MAYIGLDLGSTYTKAAVFSEGNIGKSRSVKTPLPKSSGLRYEIDADEYMNQIFSLLDELWSDEIRVLFISTQMHGCILADSSFRPLSPYISWQDKLGAKWLNTLKDEYGVRAVEPSGVPWKGNLSLCALLARRKEGETLPEDACFCTLGGYLIGCLTGSHVCHMTNAAPSGMADVRKGTWNRELIAKAGLQQWHFPKIICGLEPCGLWRGVPVYPDLGDQQVCAAGALLSPDATLHVSIGTAGLIGMLTPEWGGGNYENRPWVLPGMYLRTVSGLPGGRHLTSFAQNILQMAQFLSGKEISLETVLAYLADCAGAPARDAKAFWQAASAENSQTFVQNLYASFAEAYENAAARFDIPVREISFSGGCAAKNTALRHRVVESFGVPSIEGDHDVWFGMNRIAEIAVSGQ